MSLGHTSSQADVDRAVDVIVDAVTTLRAPVGRHVRRRGVGST